MILSRFYDEKLAQASYLFGCSHAGEALIIDPNRDIEQYVSAGQRAGLRITAVTETHIHADFASGARELAQRTGARLLLSDEGTADWKYHFAAAAGATLLHHHDRFSVGKLGIEALHTPGHTPEHLSFLVTDTAVGDQPMGIVTGDFVFVGDVGRPDLLEKAAHVQGNAEQAARILFRSLDLFRGLPDHLQVWPGHGAGSACGKGLSAMPQSTVGYEKLFNWAFQIRDEAEFVREVLAGQPEPPRYFAEMKRLNKVGPAILGGFQRPRRLPDAELQRLLDSKTIVVDTRPAAEFAAGHVPGTINIPLNRSFTNWAGWLLPYDGPFYLIVDDRTAQPLDEAVRDLAMIGLDQVGGYFGTEVIRAVAASGRRLGTVTQALPAEVHRSNGGGSGTPLILDVRNASEWEAGHLPHATHIPLGYLPERLGELPRDRDIVVHCQGGGRSAIAASILLANGFSRVVNLGPGFGGWQAAGLPVEP